MAKTLKVLLVDSVHNEFWRHMLQRKGFEIELVMPAVLSTKPYEADPDVCAVLEKITRMCAADVVILGNNLGAGLAKAVHIAGDMRSRTIVVWNDPPHEAVTAPYRTLGFTRFCTRTELAETVRSMFNTN